MKVKKFKLKTGNSQIYSLEKDVYIEKTQGNDDYNETGKDGKRRHFAICPACDNPIQIIGLYSRNENAPSVYGKHYNKSIKIAEYNKQMYYFCPYASHKYAITRDSKKPELTDFERNVYNILRENFDIAVRVVEEETGMFISYKMARKMAHCFWANDGHMYYWATLYNIPWLLLMFLDSEPCYGLRVKIGSPLHCLLKKQKEITFESCDWPDYECVRGADNRFLNLNFATIHHRRNIVNDELQENMTMFFSKFFDSLPETQFTLKLDINEYCFLNRIHSVSTEKYRKGLRSQRLLQIAAEELPEL